MTRQNPTTDPKVASWPKEVVERAQALKKLGPADKPFPLAAWAFVNDPVKFHEMLLGDIAAGPLSPRGRTGSAVADLDLYWKARGL